MGIRADFDVEMKTRDGVILRADVYRPEIDDPLPAIVLRTPYDKSLAYSRFDGFGAVFAARNGYAFVIQDVRGRWASEGEYQPISKIEGPDGYDCIEWLTEQSWCDGNVGMIGSSYESLVQFMAAEAQPPGLRAIVPEFSGDARRGSFALDATLIAWAAGQAMDWLAKRAAVGEASAADMEVVASVMHDPQVAARHLPLADMPLMKIGDLFSYAEMLEILRSAAGIEFSRIQVPALLVGGWYDIDPAGCAEIFRGLRTQAASEVARRDSAVVLGPWQHSMIVESVGEGAFGPSAHGLAMGLPARLLAFFDRHLRGASGSTVPTATYFVTGSKVWKEAAEWPPSESRWDCLYLQSSGGANSQAGDGVLHADAPDSPAVADRFIYDPADPVPGFGGRYFRIGGSLPGPFDQRRIESRDDVLVYTSESCSAAVEVVGDARLILHASTSCVDTDFVVKLCDVAPDGLSHNISDAFLRLRWRDGTDVAKFVEPGQVYEIALGLGPIAHTFGVGHRLRVQIASSAFPAYDRNMNTGHPEGSDAVGLKAEQSVWHGGDLLSRLEFQRAPVGS